MKLGSCSALMQVFSFSCVPMCEIILRELLILYYIIPRTEDCYRFVDIVFV